MSCRSCQHCQVFDQKDDGWCKERNMICIPGKWVDNFRYSLFSDFFTHSGLQLHQLTSSCQGDNWMRFRIMLDTEIHSNVAATLCSLIVECAKNWDAWEWEIFYTNFKSKKNFLDFRISKNSLIILYTCWYREGVLCWCSIGYSLHPLASILWIELNLLLLIQKTCS